jgi:hypothetical protein
MRQVMQKLLEPGISMPDEARELIVPKRVPVRLIKEDATNTKSIETQFIQKAVP